MAFGLALNFVSSSEVGKGPAFEEDTAERKGKASPGFYAFMEPLTTSPFQREE